MAEYKVNLKFKEKGKSLNEVIAETLKININNIVNKNCNILKLDSSFNSIHYFQVRERKMQ